KIGRISSTPSPGIGFGHRFAHSIASSIDFTFHSQNPAINSFVSANGPSETNRLGPENLTRTPWELGCKPSPASMTPAFTSSSLKLPMSVSSFGSGRVPASDSFVAFTITITRICLSPAFSKMSLFTYKSNDALADRQGAKTFYPQISQITQISPYGIRWCCFHDLN